MTLSRIAWAGLVASLVGSWELPARADAKACAAAAELGQRARAAGKLRQARASFLACATDECPALVRRDCQEWGAAVTEALPSIIVDARDGAGHDVGDVRVTMDGELLTKAVDGTAITVDPGPHTFVFERGAAPSVTENAIIKERVKGRTFLVRFDTGESSAPAAPIAAPSDEAAGYRHHTVGPWIVVGIGGAVLLTGAVFYVTAPKIPPNCNEASGSCTLSPNEDPAQLAKERAQAGTSAGNRSIGVIAMLAGAGIIGGGLLWHLLEPTGPRSAHATLVPWSTADGAGLAAIGAF